MNSDPLDNSARSRSVGFPRWAALFMISYGTGTAVLVAMVAIGLAIPVRMTFIPFLLLMFAGFVGATLIYAARLRSRPPKSAASLFAGAVFGFFVVYLSSVLFGAEYVGILPSGSSRREYGPWVLPGAVLLGFVVFQLERRRLERLGSNGPTSAGTPKR